METVNKYVSAASNAIWGEDSSSSNPHNLQHGEEPISGVQGKGGATDPYDAGNREEQPGAINVDGNTAPQEPKLGGKQQTFEEAALTSVPAPTKSALDSNNTTGVIDPNASIGKPITGSEANTSSSIGAGVLDPTASLAKPLSGTNTSTAPVSAEATQPLPDEGAGSSSGPTDTAPSTKEQRSTAETDFATSESTNKGESHASASAEALKGPQGPAPKSAEDFEKETKRKGSVVMEKDNTKDHEKRKSYESRETNKDCNKSDHSSQDSEKGSGKHGAMSKMKEGIKKHLHHSSK
ncbi:hypothetical protein PENANT_c007G04109 [Penicillium antarcticum]|uniref:Uncharacterized protein n=1 Tax=Penicillium antarcticum TaxID=416450 RepID=A0A1V6QBB4_9EURO|nr:uncharacterized protein N7508_003389 [Penicillium antarcticum]KAJ5312559.1 hypothetical protein N7508_003389 [Penicillium antarcticum]OQD86521.1 hypothetical protein PENANT_c007G04109 [Penicillium antarcticum]